VRAEKPTDARRPFLDLGEHSQLSIKVKARGSRQDRVGKRRYCNEISVTALRGEQKMKIIQAALENQVIDYIQFHKDRRGEEGTSRLSTTNIVRRPVGKLITRLATNGSKPKLLGLLEGCRLQLRCPV
jgi:hypothetical protein